MNAFVCLTNIPTPYRLFQFLRMQEQLRERGWSFEAWFMAPSEPEREWKFSPSDFNFPHRFLRGVHARMGGNSLHWNREIFGILRDTRPEILLVAGAWIQPTVWAVNLSSAAGRTIFWSESHLESIRRDDTTTNFARRLVLRRFNEFAVPGVLAKQYVERHTQGACIHLLPNLVDPCLYRTETGTSPRFARRDPEKNDSRVLLLVARLSEEKGLLRFLAGICGLNRAEQSRLAVLIAGSGPLRRGIERWTADHDLNVRLLGHQQQHQMAALYAQADGFCLSSISDPNPLSVIEALWAGLPLILSSRVGSHPECLCEGRNGFIFNPYNLESIAGAVSKWLALSREDLTRFGKASLTIAQTNFGPELVISRFLDDVLSDSSSRPRERLVSKAAAR